MKSIIILLNLIVAFSAYSQEYKTIDEAFPTEKTTIETYEISENATRTPKEKKLRKRAKDLLISGAAISIVSAGVFYYNEQMLKNTPNYMQTRNASFLTMLVGGGIMIGATIPLAKANKIKRNGY